MWKFYKDNINTGKTVAGYFNSKNELILEVYEGKKSYYTISKYTFIKAYAIDYSEEIGLEEACELIEKDYLKQVERIRKVID